MRLIDANKLYEYLDNKYPCDKYVELEDIFEIIEKCQTVNAIKIPPNATNGDVMMMVFKEIQYYSDSKICANWWNEEYKQAVKNEDTTNVESEKARKNNNENVNRKPK